MSDFRQAYQSTVVEAHFDDAYEVELATPWQRIAAALIDWLLVLIFPIVVFVMLAFGLGLAASSWSLDTEESRNLLVGGVIVVGVLICLGLLVYQVVLMSRDGQTLGKKQMRIRVITTDGETAGFVRHFLLRFCAYYLIVWVIGALLPWEMEMANGKTESPVGTIALLICLLMLFFRSKRRRTLQDLLARTLVVKA